MKHLLFLLFAVSMFAQQEVDQFSQWESERSLAMKQLLINPNTANYDVQHQLLEIQVDPANSSIAGTVTTTFRAISDMAGITFDLSNNMVVSSVMMNGAALTFNQNLTDELTITFANTISANEVGEIAVSYSGNPISSGFGSYEATTHNNDPIVWTLSEPYGAKGWWPCKQDLNDKIDLLDVKITTPVTNADGEEYVAVSNGMEQGQTVANGLKTTHYRHQHPIPAYLVAFAVTNYAVYSHTVENNGNPFEIINYVYPESLESSQASTAVTVDIMNLFIDLFEPYPYEDEKYGHAQFGWGGGMEHTTVSFMGGFSRGLIAHELAHQWFGDKVTCGSWRDIWLNEGFATFLTGLVSEHLDGTEGHLEWKVSKINSITSQPDGSVYLAEADTTNVGRIFSSRLSYNKGSIVLHMLRKKMGDEAFFQGVQTYLSHPDLAYAYAKTVDFIPIMEAAHGSSLTEFFQDWLYREGYPSYDLQWTANGTNEIVITLNQTQSHESVAFFEAGVKIRMTGANGAQEDVLLDHTTSGQSFTVATNFEVTDLIFDPEKDLISNGNSVTLGLSNPQWQSGLRVYPNPTFNSLRVDAPGIKIKSVSLYNAQGQFLKKLKRSNDIDLSGISAGQLVLVFETNKGRAEKIIVKQ